MKAQFLIAAPSSGSGKTTVARGLMALLTSRSYRVQPFKCGPDYIDTKFHQAVCGRPSINLDTFMATPDHVRELFEHYGQDADICIVEGMMGLFDGYDRDRGSSAEIAAVLGIPVVLVVDARSAAYSMAPLLQGFIHFRDDVHICGVIFNKVGSDRHAQMLRQVCDDLSISCFGCVPKAAALEQGSRYLGLDFSEQGDARMLTNLLDKCLDWNLLAEKTKRTHLAQRLSTNGTTATPQTNHVLIARNAESFSFLYQEAIDHYSHVDFFDPETDVPCMDGVDLLFLPGGYPEKHLEALAKNEACRQAIRDFAERGGHIQAECGGMMYLCREIVADAPHAQSSGQDSPDCESIAFPMCGVLPYSITARQADRKLSLGYRRFTLNGREYRGHEFHYTQFLGEVPPSIVQVCDAKGNPVPTPVLKYKNVLASYTHLYAGFALMINEK